MNFKDYIAQDNQAVFFNLDEYGEFHDIDGKNILVVIDTDILKEKNVNGGSMYASHSGVMLSEFTLFIKSTDIEEPAIGQHINLDGSLYLVTDVAESSGIYQITLGANQA